MWVSQNWRVRYLYGGFQYYSILGSIFWFLDLWELANLAPPRLYVIQDGARFSPSTLSLLAELGYDARFVQQSWVSTQRPTHNKDQGRQSNAQLARARDAVTIG